MSDHQMMARPLLFVDIDGVISLFGFEPAERPAGQFHSVDGIPHLLSAAAAQHLHELDGHFELVWCSGWEEKANEYLPHLLGLRGPFPHLEFDRNPGRSHAHWKLDPIERFAGPQRPLAWIDDALDQDCRTWAAARPAPTLLVQTDPARGIGEPEVLELISWAEGLAA